MPIGGDVAPPSPPPQPQARGAANLLDVVPAKVAVSSTVVNPHDFPEFLVDGRSETAWNGKTGDLVGGTITFRVPSDARVQRIELSAGYDRIKGAVDLFTANHRITKVLVSRDGTRIGDFTLDPTVRKPQPIAVDGPGGTYEIKVLATLPGTRQDWKELAVSELRVVGVPGAERRAAGDPLRVVVGSIDQEPETMADSQAVEIVKASADLSALCTEYLRDVAALKAELEETAHTHDIELHGPSCAEIPTPLTAAFKADATYKRVLMVAVSDGLRSGRRLVVEVPRGLVLTSIGWTTDDPLDPGCPSIVRVDRIDGLRIENGHLVAVLGGQRGGYDAAGNYQPFRLRGAEWCKEAGGKLGCKYYEAQYRPLLEHFAITPGGTLVRQGEATPSAAPVP